MARAAPAREDVPLSGRRAEAAANDARIIESARAVFLADPKAPISAVAKHAGVGISALYSRYGSKEALIRTLASDGLQRFIVELEAALADERDEWTAFADFMRRAADAETSALTVRLAGTFTPSPEMYAEAERAGALMTRLHKRLRRAKVIRPDLVVDDVSLAFELLTAISGLSPERTQELRHRYLALLLDGMRAPGGDPLPGPPPGQDNELTRRWDA